MIQGASGDHKMLSDPVYLAILRVRYVKIPHGCGPLMDVAHKKNVGKNHRRLFLNFVKRTAGRRSSPGSMPDGDIIAALIPGVLNDAIIPKIAVGDAQLDAKMLHYIHAGRFIDALLVVPGNDAVDQISVRAEYFNSLINLLHRHHLLFVYARPYACFRRALD